MITTKLLAEARRVLEEGTYDTKIDTPFGKGIHLQIGGDYVNVRAEEPEPFTVNGIRIRGNISYRLPEIMYQANSSYIRRTTPDSKGKNDLTDNARHKLVLAMKDEIKKYIDRHPDHVSFGKKAKLQGDLDRLLGQIKDREQELVKLRQDADRLKKELAGA